METFLCFVCSQEIEENLLDSTSTGTSITSILKRPSLKNFDLLGHILELEETTQNFQKDHVVQYCEGCLSRVVKILDLLEELERLEQQIIQEKYFLEQQFKATKRNQGQEDFRDDPNRFQEFREEIVNQLKTSTIRSTLSKIRRKTIGQRRPSLSKQFKDSRVQIMKGVQIQNLNIHQFPLEKEDQESYSNQTLKENSIPESFLRPSPNYLSNPNSQESVETEAITSKPTQIMSEFSPSIIIPIPVPVSKSNSSFVDIVAVKSEDIDPQCEANLTDPLGNLEILNENGFEEGNGRKPGSGVIPDGLFLDDCHGDRDMSSSHFSPNLENPHHQGELLTQISAETVYSSLNPSNENSSSFQYPSSSTSIYSKTRGPSPKQCEDCGLYFQSSLTLRTHKRKVHRDLIPQHNCTQCNYSCDIISNLNRHIFLCHMNIWNFSCCFCPQKFKLKANFKKHLLIHHKTLTIPSHSKL